jgi:hypothetical protein
VDGVLCKNGCVEPYGLKCSIDCPCLKVHGGKSSKALPGVLQLVDKSRCKCTCPNRQSHRVPLAVLS